MVSLSDLIVSIDGSVGRLTINRPKRLNAMSLETQHEIIAAATWFDEHHEVKVVVVSGSGGTFSAGVDTSVLVDVASDPAAEARDDADLGRRMAEAVEQMDAITVAAIEGHCVGGGLVLAAACDLRIAVDSTYFAIPELDAGIPLAWGGIPRLVRELGPALTKELVLTCRPFTAEEANMAGFINDVVDAGRLDAAVDQLVANLAARPGQLLTSTKRAIQKAAEDLTSTADAAADVDLLLAALADPASRRAAAAYLERFSPQM
jgi:enoyl-CoA hydratase/carnithine racemase